MEPNPGTNPHDIKSPPWSKVALAVCVIEIVLLVAYVYLFYTVDPAAGNAGPIFDYRVWLLPAIPMLLLVHFFVLGLWIHTLYVDAFNLFGNKDLNPHRAMMLVLIPVVNIYGLGISLSRVAAEAEKVEARKNVKDSGMVKAVRFMKLGLLMLYAAVTAIVLALVLYSFRVSFNAIALNDMSFKIFNTVQFVAIAGSVIGLAISVASAQAVISRQWKLIVCIKTQLT